MVRKRSPDRDAKPPRIDDLKVINGIGPAVEKRLNGVGIHAYAQLAALSPADIAAAVADLAGLSSERIIKQDWIGQARKLAAGSAVREAQGDVEVQVKPPDPIVPAQVALHPVGSQQPDLQTVEAILNEAQKDVEAPILTEQVVTSATPVEPAVPMEYAHPATLSVEPEKDVEPSMEQYHPATYTVQFLLDEDNNVHSTHVLHVQSRREETWAGWQKTRLEDFLSESAGLNIQSDEPALLSAEEPDYAPEVAESEPLTPLVAKHKLVGTLRGREMEVIGVKSGVPGRTLAQDDPFNVRLTLDLTELQVPSNTPLNYKASLYSKNRSGPSGLVLGEAQGTIISADTITIKVEGNTLPEGIYHLAAMVIIGLPGMKLAVRPGTTAVIDGGKIQVY